MILLLKKLSKKYKFVVLILLCTTISFHAKSLQGCSFDEVMLFKSPETDKVVTATAVKAICNENETVYFTATHNLDFCKSKDDLNNCPINKLRLISFSKEAASVIRGDQLTTWKTYNSTEIMAFRYKNQRPIQITKKQLAQEGPFYCENYTTIEGSSLSKRIATSKKLNAFFDHLSLLSPSQLTDTEGWIKKRLKNIIFKTYEIKPQFSLSFDRSNLEEYISTWLGPSEIISYRKSEVPGLWYVKSKVNHILIKDNYALVNCEGFSGSSGGAVYDKNRTLIGLIIGPSDPVSRELRRYANFGYLKIALIGNK